MSETCSVRTDAAGSSWLISVSTPLTSFHWEGVQTAYISPEGNFVGDADMKADSIAVLLASCAVVLCAVQGIFRYPV